jgi:ATP-binding cassette subfamily C (CFTR/MRP) protein 1
MDSGRIAEFDTVLALFDRQASIFRSLCNEAGLSRQDILHIRAERAFHGQHSDIQGSAVDATHM